MPYLELGSVLFRGNLKGATGRAQFKLSADSIDAVDRINIKGGEITSYVIAANANPVIVDPGNEYLAAVINSNSASNLVDICGYMDAGNNKCYLKFNDNVLSDRSRKNEINNDLFRCRAFYKAQVGDNRVSIVNYGIAPVTIYKGFLMAGYLRRTGA